ncbi:MAG TPA: HNH endonuclease [Microbacteriaceae bacterium]
MESITERIREGALQVCSFLTVSDAADVGSAAVGSAAVASVAPASAMRGAAMPGCAEVTTAVAASASASACAQEPASAPLSVMVDRLDDDRVQALVAGAAALRSEVDAVIAAGAGVLAKRSERDLGYQGLAQRTGHRTPVGLLQSLTGSSRVEAARQVRLGEAMAEADAATNRLEEGDNVLDGEGNTAEQPFSTPDSSPDNDGSGDGRPGAGAPGDERPDTDPPVMPWFEPVTRAVAEHMLSSEAASAILRGLGEPNEHYDGAALRIAAIELIGDAAGMHVDELTKRARWARDQADPRGVEERFAARYQERTWRFGHTADGARTAWVRFDDESAAWVDAIVGAGMRPRRGGPRFVAKDEAERAEKLVEDPRSNDQLVFDLLMDTLRAGSQADPSIAFGSRQPGIRVIISETELNKHDENGTPTGVGYFEETGEAVPTSLITRLICNAGIQPILTDALGIPIDVGREQRLFTTKQRIALAFRDGGCMCPGCDRPPSYTEAHHIDEWVADNGRTDLSRGMLLCRYHHMLIHNNGWKIIRENATYWLVPPPGIDTEQTPIPLHSKAPKLARPLAATGSSTGTSPANRRVTS